MEPQNNDSKMNRMEESYKNQASMYYDKYQKHMNMFEDSVLAKTRTLNEYDFFMLGKMLEQYDEYEDWVMNEQTSLAGLGRLPQIAHDVITVSMGQSIIPAIASIQPKLLWAA